MELKQINTNIEEFKSEIEDLVKKEKKLKKDLGVLQKEYDKDLEQFKHVSKLKNTQESNDKKKEEEVSAKLALYSIFLSIGVWVFVGYI